MQANNLEEIIMLHGIVYNVATSGCAFGAVGNSTSIFIPKTIVQSCNLDIGDKFTATAILNFEDKTDKVRYRAIKVMVNSRFDIDEDLQATIIDILSDSHEFEDECIVLRPEHIHGAYLKRVETVENDIYKKICYNLEHLHANGTLSCANVFDAGSSSPSAQYYALKTEYLIRVLENDFEQE
jgi:hypothetical protein